MTPEEYAQRVRKSRMRIMQQYPFFGLLLMYVRFAVDQKCSTAATDGERIFFGPAFLEKLPDAELDFVMLHEILHIVLGHVFRGKDFDDGNFNIACDIVVNSNIMLEQGRFAPFVLTGYGEAMHLAPDGNEGHLYSAEQVYDMLPKNRGGGTGKEQGGSGGPSGSFDEHDKWQNGGGDDDKGFLRDAWEHRITNAALTVEIMNASKTSGDGACFFSRMLRALRKPQHNWRDFLNSFVQEDITDYSFSPPDRRFDDTEFFLPDYNEKTERVRNIWFVIDTSGSVTDPAIAAAYSEIKGAIEQFDGHLDAMLSFMEGYTADPIPFSSVDDLMSIKPVGGGGTNFTDIFRYLEHEMMAEPPSSIIIITDGYDEFPPEAAAYGIPVLWLINNDEVEPPWGKVARIKV